MLRQCLLLALLVAFCAFASPAAAQSPKFHHVQGGTLRDVFALTDQELWTAEEAGRIRYSQDGGATWGYADTPEDLKTDLAAVFVIDLGGVSGLLGWAVGDDGVVLQSTDQAAQTWDYVNTSPVLNAYGNPAKLYDIWMFNSTDGWCAGYDGALRSTQDGGVT